MPQRVFYGGVEYFVPDGYSPLGGKTSQEDLLIALSQNPGSGAAPGVSISSYYAYSSGGTDWGPAFTQALSEAYLVWVPGGQFPVITPVNACNYSNGRIIRGQGITSQIQLNCTGLNGFECTGSLGITFQDIWIQGNQTNTPACGLLFARTTGNGSAGQHKLLNTAVTGWYTKGAVVHISSEVNEWHASTVTNFQSGATSFWHTAANEAGIVPKYAPFPAVFSGGATVFHAYGGYISNSDSAMTAGTGKQVVLADCQDVGFHGTFLSSQGLASIYCSGDVNGLSLHGSSAEWQGSLHGVHIAAGKTLANLSIQGFNGYGIVYGDTGATLKLSDINGTLTGSPYGVDVDILENCQINAGGFAVRARTRWDGVTRSGQIGVNPDSYPTSQYGNVYLTDVLGGDGRQRRIAHINDQGLYSETSTKWATSDMFRTRCQWIQTVATGSLAPNLNTGGAFLSVKLDANVAIAGPTGPFPFNNTKDEGAQMTFIFTQDATGGRTVTFDSNYLTTSFALKTAANAVTAVGFILDPQSAKWVQISTA